MELVQGQLRRMRATGVLPASSLSTAHLDAQSSDALRSFAEQVRDALRARMRRRAGSAAIRGIKRVQKALPVGHPLLLRSASEIEQLADVAECAFSLYLLFRSDR